MGKPSFAAMGDALVEASCIFAISVIGLGFQILRLALRLLYRLLYGVFEVAVVLFGMIASWIDMGRAVAKKERFLCLQDHLACDGLGPSFWSYRILKEGEEISTTQEVRRSVGSQLWRSMGWEAWPQNWPDAVTLADGSWVAFRSPWDGRPPVALLHTASTLMAFLGETGPAPREGIRRIVCKTHLDCHQSCAVDSPVLRKLCRGDIICAMRGATLQAARKQYQITRIQLKDGSWITCRAADVDCVVRASLIEEADDPHKRALLVHRLCLKKEIQSLTRDYKGLVDFYGLGAVELYALYKGKQLKQVEEQLAGAPPGPYQIPEIERLEDLGSLLGEACRKFMLRCTRCSTVEELPAFLTEISRAPRDAFASNLMQREHVAQLVEALSGCGTAGEFSGFLSQKCEELLRNLLGATRIPRCFLPSTMLWVSNSVARTVTDVKQGDMVQNVFGRDVVVSSCHRTALPARTCFDSFARLP